MADLTRKAQQAIIDWLGQTSTHGGSIAGVTVTHFENEGGFSIDDGPRVVVTANRGNELSPDTGIFALECDVTLYAHGNDTTEAEMESVRGAIETALQWDALPAALSAQLADFKVWGLIDRGGDAPRNKDGMYVWAYEVNLYAQAQD
jgi:hypothetical protein